MEVCSSLQVWFNIPRAGVILQCHLIDCWVLRIGRRFRLRLQCCIETNELRHYSCMTSRWRWRCVELIPPSLSIREKFLGSIYQGQKVSWLKIIHCWVLGTKRILESHLKKLHLQQIKLLLSILPTYLIWLLNDSLAFMAIS